jgi:hypothetical protein
MKIPSSARQVDVVATAGARSARVPIRFEGMIGA